MPTGSITGIIKPELFEALTSAVSEAAATSDASEEAAEKAVELFWRQLEDRSRPLSEVAEQTRDDPATMLVIIENVAGTPLGELVERMARFVDDRERFSLLVTALTPDASIPSEPVLEQARRNAVARTAFLSEFPTVSSGEIADLYGSTASNRAALAQGWRKQGRIFAVPTTSSLRFPLFQFRSDGQPKPAVAPVLRQLERAGLHGWEVALWFSSALASLDGARPADVLDEEAARVETAAAQLSDIPY